MLNITFLVGPPASGKTYIARQMMSMFPEHKSIVIYNDRKKLEDAYHRRFHQNICIEECTKPSIISLIESIISLYDAEIYDPIKQECTGVKAEPTNIIICTQNMKLVNMIIAWRNFPNVNINIIELSPYKSLKNVKHTYHGRSQS